MELSIQQILIGRFLLNPNSPTTYVLAPRMWQWASDHGYAVDPLTSTVARDSDWDQCRNLEYNIVTIIRNKDEFQMLLLEMIQSYPSDLNRYTTKLTQAEYSILLFQGGQEVYDWFVMDHRFGAPPRGKAFRSNIKGPWKAIPRKRPDNAINKLRYKIEQCERKGWDVSDLLVELARREWCLENKLDWKVKSNRPPAVVIPLKAAETQSNSR
jgi:hypothetical protein